MTSKATKTDAPSKEDAVFEVTFADEGDLSAPPKSVRHRLPDTRPAVNHKFSIGGHDGYLNVGLYENGQPGEVFITVAKEGSTLSGLMDSFALVFSIALQHGVPLEVLVSKLAHTSFDPSGWTGNEEMGYAKSIMDYLARWLELRFLKSQQGKLFVAASSPTAAEPVARVEVTPELGDAPPCPTCGSLTTRNRTRAYAESFAAEGRYDVHAMSILQAENKLTHAESKAAWNDIVKFLSNPGNTRIMKKAGRVGEGEFLTEPGLYGANVERYVRYDVHESLIHDWDQHIGTSIEERFGAKKGQSVMIGRSNGNPVTAGGTENFIENMFDMGEGKTGILVRETRPIGTGTKFDKGSLKGNDHAFAAKGDAAIFREGLNEHSKAVGINAVIPNEVNMFVSQVYDTNKGSEMLPLCTIVW